MQHLATDCEEREAAEQFCAERVLGFCRRIGRCEALARHVSVAVTRPRRATTTAGATEE